MLLTAFQDDPEEIAVDASNVYWINFGPSGSSIMKMPLAGGDPVELATSVESPDLAVAGSYVYFITRGLEPSINRVPIAGGTPTVLASGAGFENTQFLAVESSYVYWTNYGGAADSSGSIMRVPLGGGTRTILAAGVDSPAPIAVCDGYVYWGSNGFETNGLFRMTVTGGSPSLLEPGHLGFISLAVDAIGVYAVGSGPKRDLLVKYAHDGSTQVTLGIAPIQVSRSPPARWCGRACKGSARPRRHRETLIGDARAPHDLVGGRAGGAQAGTSVDAVIVGQGRILLNTLSGSDRYRWRRVCPKSLRTQSDSVPPMIGADSGRQIAMKAILPMHSQPAFRGEPPKANDSKRGYP